MRYHIFRRSRGTRGTAELRRCIPTWTFAQECCILSHVTRALHLVGAVRSWTVTRECSVGTGILSYDQISIAESRHGPFGRRRIQRHCTISSLVDTKHLMPITEAERIQMVELDVRLFRYSNTIQVCPCDTVEVLHMKAFVTRVEEYHCMPFVHASRINYDVAFLTPNEYHPCG